MSTVSLSGFIQHSAVGVINGRQAFVIEVKCKDEAMEKLIQDRLKNFLNNDNLFSTAVADIEGCRTTQGWTVLQFLVNEGYAESEAKGRRMVSSGSVQVKDKSGNWKIIGSAEAALRPGWWRITRKGLIKIGSDFIIEKRLENRGIFSKPMSQLVPL